MGKLLILSVLILLGSFGFYLKTNYDILKQVDKQIENINDDICRRIPLKTNGPEDIQRIDDDYLLTVTGNTIEIWNHYGKDQKDVASGEFILIPSNGIGDLVFLDILNFPKEYKIHAHGIYAKGYIVYVINHAYKYGGERIDVFEISPKNKTATYLKTFQIPKDLFGITNDLVVLDDEDESFFITQW